jgi:hypothetical protein
MEHQLEGDMTMSDPDYVSLEQPKKSSEEIVVILRSITKMSFDSTGDFDVWFDNDEHPSGIHEFMPDSFTRELLELIADHLK